MGQKVGLLVVFIVALSVVGGEGGRTLADVQEKEKDDSPALTHWQHVLPTISIPHTLKELISPLSSKETAQILEIIDKDKAVPTVTPNIPPYHDSSKNARDGVTKPESRPFFSKAYTNVAGAKLLDNPALCKKGNLDCKPTVTVTPNPLFYHTYKNVADAK